MRFISRSSPVSHPAANCLSRRWAYTLVEPQLDETGTADWQPQQASGCAADAQNQVRHVAAGSRAFATVVAVLGARGQLSVPTIKASGPRPTSSRPRESGAVLGSTGRTHAAASPTPSRRE